VTALDTVFTMLHHSEQFRLHGFTILLLAGIGAGAIRYALRAAVSRGRPPEASEGAAECAEPQTGGLQPP
jgi:Zn-dependent protease with chaperone function